MKSPQHPDRFYVEDKNSGARARFASKNKYEGDVYDTVNIPVTAPIAAGTQFEFFRDVQNKLELDCNLGASRKLRAGSRLMVLYVGIYIEQAAGAVQTTISDAKSILDNAFLEVRINDNDVARGPAHKYAIGYGLVGNSTRANTDTFTSGVASPAAIRPLLVPQWVSNNEDIEARMTFQARTWPAVAPAMPTTTTMAHVKQYLKGIMYR